MRDVQLGQVYRHFKGDYYLVEALARDSETNEPCVIYRKLYGDGGLWVRPLDMFLSPVDREKYPDAGQTYRFELQTIPSRAGHRGTPPSIHAKKTQEFDSCVFLIVPYSRKGAAVNKKAVVNLCSSRRQWWT